MRICPLVFPSNYHVGVERHTGFSFLPPGAPNSNTAWGSFGTTVVPGGRWWQHPPFGDQASGSVFQASDDEGVVKLGSSCKEQRDHICLGSPVPPPVTPIADFGNFHFVIASGNSKTVWGPSSVKADVGGEEHVVAVMLHSDMFNHTVCCKPVRAPTLGEVQRPNTVFAGMTDAEIDACWAQLIIDAALEFARNNINSRFTKIFQERIPNIFGENDLSNAAYYLLANKVFKEALKLVTGNLQLEAQDARE